MKSPFALRIASPSSDEVRRKVCPRYRWATTWTLSPRLATYRALPGGAMVVSDGSGAADTNGVEDRDVFTSLGCKVCAAGNRQESQRERKKEDRGECFGAQ